MKKFTALLLAALFVLCLVSCTGGNAPAETGRRETASESNVSLPNTGLTQPSLPEDGDEAGEGKTSFTFEAVLPDKTVTLTVHTDEENVGAALLSLGLIGGDDGPYGLYIKTVLGVRADYDLDGAYWAFYENGEMAMTGADGCAVCEGGVYSLVYSE